MPKAALLISVTWGGVDATSVNYVPRPKIYDMYGKYPPAAVPGPIFAIALRAMKYSKWPRVLLRSQGVGSREVENAKK